MPIHTPRRFSRRTLQALLALAAASPAAAFADTSYTLYTLGLYDSSSSAGSHTAANGVSNETISFFNAADQVAGTAARYTSNTVTYNASGATAGNNVWFFDPTSQQNFTIGFTDASYTAANGTQAAVLKGMDSAGNVVGTSTQYLTNSVAGTTAWIYLAPNNANSSGSPDPGTTAAIRLSGDSNVVYVKSANTTNGSVAAESSAIAAINPSGVIVGSSARYSAANTSISEGTSAWIASVDSGTVTTTNIGLTGTKYSKTTDVNFQSSSVVGVNTNGQAAGTSVNYSVNPSGFTDAWFYNPISGTKVIGLTGVLPNDPNFALSSNYTSSSVTLAPTAGGVAGISTTTGGVGQTAWVYNIAARATSVVSLAGSSVPNGGTRGFYYGGTNNSNVAYQSNSIVAINASGQAIGFQSIYNANATSAIVGNQDAFFFNGTTTQVVGLTSANYTNSSTTPGVILRTNAVNLFNDNAQMAGTTAIYKAGATNGRDAWFYASGQGAGADGSNAIPIGLPYSAVSGFDKTPYSNPITGLRTSSVNRINVVGQVAGTSARFLSDGTSAGTDAYLFTPDNTSVQVGLFGDAAHSFVTTSGGAGTLQTSAISALNATGLVAGTSTRYTTAGVANGNEGWLYDSTSNTTYSMALTGSINPITDASNQTVQYLSDTGLLLGSYTRYDSTTGASLGTFAYAFSESKGVFDLGLNTTNLSAAGWQQLDTTFAANAGNDIAGYGTLGSDSTAFGAGNQAAYLLLAPIQQHFLLGDCNDDGKVDLNDLNTVLNNLGITSSRRSDGNFDGAPTIDLNDLNDVLNNLGVTASTSTVAQSAESLVAQTPEPASLSLLALSGTLLLRRRR